MTPLALTLALPCRADEPDPGPTVVEAWTALESLGPDVRLAEILVCLNGDAPPHAPAIAALRAAAESRASHSVDVYLDAGELLPCRAADAQVSLTLLHTRRAGKAIAWNVLRQRARGDIVVFLDSDVHCGSGALAALIDALRVNPNAVLAGGRTVVAPRRGWFERVQATPYGVEFPNLSPQMYGARLAALPPAMPEGLLEPERWLELVVGCERIARVPRATVAVRLPHTLRDFLRQRVRIEMGKVQIADEYPGLARRGTRQPRAGAALARYRPADLGRLAVYLALRESAHLVAAWRYRRRGTIGVWRQATSTKDWNHR